jgi:hypothetical protein
MLFQTANAQAPVHRSHPGLCPHTVADGVDLAIGPTTLSSSLTTGLGLTCTIHRRKRRCCRGDVAPIVLLVDRAI